MKIRSIGFISYMLLVWFMNMQISKVFGGTDSETQSVNNPAGFGKWWTLSGYSDSGYRKTQFYAPDYDTWVFLGDGRLEFWLPPGYSQFSWGVYLRGAVIASTGKELFENSWLAAPGLGGQIYPFSGREFINQHNKLAQILGPVRLFYEHNWLYCWCDINNKRPRDQMRGGLEYWKAINVNNTKKVMWSEIWNGVMWQSTNDDNPDYDSWKYGSSLRLGIRKPRTPIISWISPYAVIDNSVTGHEKDYWDNRLRVGGGIRLAPPLYFNRRILNRLVIYSEYINNIKYFKTSPTDTTPNYDIRAGLSISIGEWLRN
jgi:hypothetical protein